MRSLMLVTCLLFATLIFAQDQTVKSLQDESGKSVTKDPNDTVAKAWKTGAIFSFNLSQASLSNWAAGGDNFALSVNGYINAHAFYKKAKNSWIIRLT